MRAIPRFALIALLIGICAAGCGRSAAQTVDSPTPMPRSVPVTPDPADRYVSAAANLGPCASHAARDAMSLTVCDLPLSDELVRNLHRAYGLAAAGSRLQARAYVALEVKRISEAVAGTDAPTTQDVRDLLAVAAADEAVGGDGSEATSLARSLFEGLPTP